jgi:hypothetical protein
MPEISTGTVKAGTVKLLMENLLDSELQNSKSSRKGLPGNSKIKAAHKQLQTLKYTLFSKSRSIVCMFIGRQNSQKRCKEFYPYIFAPGSSRFNALNSAPGFE